MPLFSLPVSLRKWGTLGASGRSGRRSPCEPGHRRPHISDGPVVVAIPFELCLPPASGQGGHRIVFGGRSEGKALAPVLEDLFLRVVEDKPCLASVKWAGPLQDPVCWVFSLCNPGQHFAMSFENCYGLHCCHTQQCGSDFGYLFIWPGTGPWAPVPWRSWHLRLLVSAGLLTPCRMPPGRCRGFCGSDGGSR